MTREVKKRKDDTPLRSPFPPTYIIQVVKVTVARDAIRERKLLCVRAQLDQASGFRQSGKVPG